MWKPRRISSALSAVIASWIEPQSISPVAWPHYQLWLPLAGLWLILAGAGRSRLIGVLVYLPFCALYAYPLYDVITTSGAQPQALLARVLWELNVLVPTLICVLGLPHRIRPAVDSGR